MSNESQSIKTIVGLNSQQVEESKSKWGDNALSAVKITTFFDRFKQNLEDPMIIILSIALIITLSFAYLGYTSPYEGIGIFFAIAIATLVATTTEHSSENSFRQLQEEASKIVCKVFRNGKVTNTFINDIVKGDYVLIQPGDIIPADGIVISGKAKVDQASLNGESKPAIKHDEPLDNETKGYLSTKNVYRGSVLIEGELTIEVDSVGDESEYGKLSKELSEDSREAPLKIALSKLADSIATFSYFASVIIALVFFWHSYQFSLDIMMMSWNQNYMDVVLKGIQAVTLAVMIIIMAVPEGLPMMIAMVLSLNMRKLIHDNVLVRKLTGIEAAGSLNILFSDKTGTITKGKLEVIRFISGSIKEYKEFDDIPDTISTPLLHTIINGSSSKIVKDEDGTIEVIGGNQTDQALSHYVSEHILEAENCTTKSKIDFDSQWKYSAHTLTGNFNATVIKGAPEVILSKCTKILNENGELEEINKSDLENKINDLAEQSMRVIAFATSNEDVEEIKDGETPNLSQELNFIGMVAIRDDIRPEAITAIEECQKAGIQVVMVTGDNLQTAKAIAKDSKILNLDSELILTSSDMEKMSDEELKEKLPNIRVIARAKPTDKSRLVKVAQELNLVVGMTGDGVNDAPALKRADVGFAMGSGTELAKEAADIVILDNNFQSIEKAVLYGRTIFNSIQKFITYQLTVNFTAIFIALIGPFIGYEMPFSLIQILWINLIMDTLAALALGGEPALRRYMKEKPKVRGTHPITKSMLVQIGYSAVFIILVSFAFMTLPEANALFRADENHIIFLSGFFSFFIFINIFNAFNVRSKSVNIFEHILENKLFLYVIGFIFVLQFILVTTGGEIFRTAPLMLNEWLIILGLSITVLPFAFIMKLFLRGK